MGIVFGKTGVAEPTFDLLLSRGPPASSLAYEIRRYGIRYAIETEYTGEDMNNAFRRLAGYIGGTSIAMTAPVITDTTTSSRGGGTKIAMTAPVVTKTTDTITATDDNNDCSSKKNKMQFILPAGYNDMSKIPKPTNPNVTVKEVPPAFGAVHKFSGWVKDQKAREKVSLLVRQLNDDGLDLKEEDAFKNFLLWQYNPPFTIPNLRRNEVWVELGKDQVDELIKRFTSCTSEK